MRDSFGREVDYLRLSVTEGCNLSCIYCRDLQLGTVPFYRSMPSPGRCAEIVEAAASLGVRKVRITGGEPCTRADLPEIVGGIAAVPGIEEVCLTTNGTLIAPMASELRAAGLARVNVSLDTLDPERYRSITRGGSLDDVLAGLEALKEAGFEGTKLNCVLMPGINDDEIDDFERFASEQGVEMRFIELMPIGPAADLYFGTVPFSGKTAKKEPSQKRGKPRKRNRPQLQVIAPLSEPFCATCNRIRVTADGFAKPCLHGAEEIDLNGLHGKDLEDALRRAILAKPACHTLATGPSGSLRDMSRIGG